MVTEGTTIDFFGIPIASLDYSQTVVPILLSAWVMSYVEKFFKKILPELVKSLFTPALTILVMLPISLCVLAPAGSYIGNFVSKGLIAFGDVGGFVAVALIAALWQWLIMTGMHVVLITFLFTILTTQGFEGTIGPAATVSMFAVFGATLGAAIRIRQKEEKTLAWGYFVAAVFGGVVEPSLYGLLIKYKRPMGCMMIASALGGACAGIFHVKMVTVAASNFLVFLSFAGNTSANLINGIIVSAIAFVAGAIITYIWGFKKDEPVIQKAN